MRYSFSIPEAYLDKIERLKAILGTNNASEIVRRAIDELASKYGVETVREVNVDGVQENKS
ncbi:MAG: ribbon-helix-helix protein, CopG family [Archaeoglobus sp.]|uniref:ribbon-helix-helix protein, CopG family n=1 Tax=Archaeoglobus sp. TaxID=1872626 RepID=UPI001D67AD0A|nr:ribbon-helix-helix protein, CopG family [Archaeoglobus sp.]MBO8180499.1 ribbon-helix-helix protein, CopG family [Archaeoglobus sp.]